jgi:hypothetical protein
MGKGTGDGAGGAGQGMSAKDDKGGSGNSGKDSKSLGESLAFLAAKKHQDKAIELYWKMKEKDAMLWPNLKEKMLEEAVMTPFKALTKGVSGMFEDFGGDKSSYVYKCDSDGSSWPVSSVPDCPSEGGKYSGGKCYNKGTIYEGPPGAAPQKVVASGCKKVAGSDDKPSPNAETTPSNQNVAGTNPLSGTTPAGGISGNNDVLCKNMANIPSGTPEYDRGQKLAAALAGIMKARKAMIGANEGLTCGNVAVTDIALSGNNLTKWIDSNETNYVKKGYGSITDADNLSLSNIGMLSSGESSKVDTDVAQKLSPAKSVADLKKALGDAKAEVEKWADATVCTGQDKKACAAQATEAAGKITEADKLFADGTKDIEQIQAKMEEVRKALADAKGKLDAANASGQAVTDGKETRKIEGCGETTPQACMNKYWETANARFETEWENYNGKNSLENQGSATRGLQKRANNQQTALKLGTEAITPSTELKAKVDNARTGESNMQLLGFRKDVIAALPEKPTSAGDAEVPAEVNGIMGKIRGDGGKEDSTLLGLTVKSNQVIETALTTHRDKLTRYQSYDFNQPGSGSPGGGE